MKNVEKQLGAQIRRQRKKRDMLQRELAEAAGVPARTVGRIERGEVDLRLSTLRKIAKALDVDIKELLP
jgi:transcriptional regulator with XRE-family HTH domain